MLLVASAFAYPVMAQEKKDDSPAYSATFTINSDSFFGLTPIAALAVPLSDNVALTGYAIFWSGIGNNAVGPTGGFGHWTEFGGGVNFTLLDGALNINPQLGILNGTLLSRGGGQAAFNEGIVPNLTVFFEKNKFELELYGGYYMGTKTQTNAKTSPVGVTTHALYDPTIATVASSTEGGAALGQLGLTANMFPNNNANYNYTHFWAFPGYQFKEWLSAGLHWEELRFRPTGGADDYDQTLYKWKGIYVTMKAGKGSLRVAFGDSEAHQSSGPSSSTLLDAGIRGGQTGVENAVKTYMNTPVSKGAMNGTYYRVTYSMDI